MIQINITDIPQMQAYLPQLAKGGEHLLFVQNGIPLYEFAPVDSEKLFSGLSEDDFADWYKEIDELYS